MTERHYNGNLFLLPASDTEAGVVTTNGIVKRDGHLVMGAGIAKYCRDSQEGIDAILGKLVAASGNHVYHVRRFDRERMNHCMEGYVNILSMPTKHHFKDPSDPELIRRSCRELSAQADALSLTRIYLPAPGCGLGGLDYWNTVRPVLMGELDSRFTVCLPDAVWNNKPADL